MAFNTFGSKRTGFEWGDCEDGEHGIIFDFLRVSKGEAGVILGSKDVAELALLTE